MTDSARTLLREDRRALDNGDAPALPLSDMDEPLVEKTVPERPETVPLESARTLVLADFQPPRTGPVDGMVRWAYRLGVPGSVLAAPLRKPAAPRLLATVVSPLQGDRAAGVALRAGQFLVHGLKVPVGKVDFSSNAQLTPPVQRAVQGFTWLRDLGACAPREDCAAIGQDLLARWLKANPVPAKGPAWTVEHAGLRLMAWLVGAPLILSGDARLRSRALESMEATARFLDREVARSPRHGASRQQGAFFPQGGEHLQQRHPQHGELVSYDTVEKLRARAFYTEHANALAYCGPFRIEIDFNERVAQFTHMQPCKVGPDPKDLAITRQRCSAVQCHYPTGKRPQMVCRVLAAGGFVEPLAIKLDQRIRSQHQIAGSARGNRGCLRRGQRLCNLGGVGIVHLRFERALVHICRLRGKRHARCFEHRLARRAVRGEHDAGSAEFRHMGFAPWRVPRAFRSLWSRIIAAAVSSIERRVTSITAQPLSANMRRANFNSSFTRSLST